MKQKALYALWAGLFIICAGLGFIPDPQGAVGVLCTVLSLCFFLPPALLVWDAAKEGRRHTLQLIRNLAALSLGLTLALLVGSFLSAFASETLGNLLHNLLVVVACPMITSGQWALSLFLWACLLMVCLKILRKK